MIPKNASCVKYPVRNALDLSQTTASAAHSEGNCLPAPAQYKDLTLSSGEGAVFFLAENIEARSV